jgi:diguanylate cyclase (GGDEF)-like protein/PAS domain S-box-containing protein
MPGAPVSGDPVADATAGQAAMSAPAAQQLAKWSYNKVFSPASAPTADLRPDGLLTPLAALGDMAAGAGHLSGAFDADGSLRYEFPAVALDGSYYPSLPIRAAAAYLGINWADVQLRLGQDITLGTYRVPLDSRNRLIVNYHGPTGSFASYSLVDVLDGKVPSAAFTGKLVLVGATGLGIADFIRTPFDERLPGVERYASIIDRILHGGALQQPAWSNLVNLAAILLLGIFVTLTASRLNMVLAIILAGLALAAWFFICQYAFDTQRLWLNLLFPSVTVIATFASIALMRGITEERQRRLAEISLRRSEERYALSARGANDGLWDWDLVSGHFYTSPRWHSITGLDPAALTNTAADWYDRVLAADLDTLQAAVQAHLTGGAAHLEHEFRLRHSDGSERWMLVRGLKIVDTAQRPVRMAGSMTDITSRKQTEQQLLFDARFDRLTGLANRASLRERADFALQMIARDSNLDALMMIIDLDRFKDVNDSLGQGTGDKLLISVARALQDVVGAQDTLAHLGEDEYGILRLIEDDAAAITDQLIAAVQQAINQPFTIDDRLIEITASIGVALASEAQTTSADTLLADANLAVYRAKAQGRARAVKFDPSMQQTALKRLDLVSDLRQAVANGNELELFYQPIMRLQGSGIHGFEALIRWRHPQHGLVSPGDFIPLAEETGMIIEIGRRCIWQTCRQIAAWQAETGFAPQVAVNVSGRQLETEAIVEDIRQALAETAIPTEALKIEITESMVMDNPERTEALLARIVALGVKVSIDDFGTGYSSLSHLHRFPFHTLKIDRSFVIRLTENREGFEICKAIAKLAHILRRDVVAEGIETTAQAEHLRGLDVEYGQGYLFSRPLPVAEATLFLRQQLATDPQLLV